MENNIKQPTKDESRIIKFMILLGIFSILNFLYYFFQPEHAGNTFLFILLTVTILYSVLKKLYMWYNYSNITVPPTPPLTKNFKVDILTTYYPGEPYQMTITTLEAINNITYPHTTYLCDEANDPFLKQFCEQNGIIHVTRDNRINAKAGNINNALKTHATGDICVVLDPDHIPEPNFLDPILPHFEDPKIGFVQIVQSYYNIKETLVARGAAEQTFQFYGPMMMTLNSYGAVNAIGANCVFRRKALDSIGGHAPGLCEDMHTAMLLYSKGWKAVYLPVVLAKGLAPSNLTSFFKQQIKWSRGTFDLLVKVYPKVFSKLTGRQQIHYGILPLHYLGGVISLINFLIPMISLFFSTTPWKGNIIDFALILAPVAASSILIRTFIQKWVIEKKERGFHIVGGLLHINSWWIYIVGLVYTIINKKVPYLPTPKENEWNTNYKIVLPNLVVAILSIIAIIYGLQQDLTPFSIIMAFFAFFNALIMFFGIYLTHRVTNQNRILRSSMGNKGVVLLWNLKQSFYRLAAGVFTVTRNIALPLLLLLLITSMGVKDYNDRSKWELAKATYIDKISGNYFGIFNPEDETGLSNIYEIHMIENQYNLDFEIISFYLGWNEECVQDFPYDLINASFEKNAIPMITWEPWASHLAVSDTVSLLQDEKKVLKYISEGYYDEYIKEFAGILKSFERPIFLRFAHEFDNPQYPWSTMGDNTPEEFKAAWKHVSTLIKREGASQVIMVWNPWEEEGMEEYYPGDSFVDWIGITLLNYGPFNPDGNYYSFEDLYTPFKNELSRFTRKPVMLAEFGSVKLDPGQQQWIDNAISSINRDHSEIGAIVLFNSAYDLNIPENDWYSKDHIDWTLNSKIKDLSEKYDRQPMKITGFNSDLSLNTLGVLSFPKNGIRGVRYKKGKEWRNNYYSLTKNELTKDFELIKELGINTIHYTGGNIYDTNLLSYTAKNNLNVIYQFSFDHQINFLNGIEKLNRIKDGILDQVKKMQKADNILAYNIAYDLELYYEKPLLFSQQQAYLRWLNTLLKEIRTIDPTTPVIVDLNVHEDTRSQIKNIREYLNVDLFGLISTNDDELEMALEIIADEEIPAYLSSIPADVFQTQKDRLKQKNLILENWQDERKSNYLKFNGLIDFQGRKKQTVQYIKSAWNSSPPAEELNLVPAILRPSALLEAGRQHYYRPIFFENGQWVLETAGNDKLHYEWNMIKTDRFGNPTAIRTIGTGSYLELTIPEDPNRYDLLLVVINNESGYISTARTTLNTPSINKEKTYPEDSNSPGKNKRLKRNDGEKKQSISKALL